ncbi:unnamed protein product [Rotaria sp. Silwood2]|nr:unnamed protein product [Rotaria sp. Silwood2]
MINFLFNNFINAIILTNAIYDHHSKSSPQFSSWRDIVDLTLIILVILHILYCLIFRAGFGPCNRCLLLLSEWFTRRLQQQQQQQQQHEEKEQFQKQIQILQ